MLAEMQATDQSIPLGKGAQQAAQLSQEKQLSTMFVQAKAILNTNKRNFKQILKQNFFFHITSYFIFPLKQCIRARVSFH